MEKFQGYFKNLLLAFLAGMCIALGGTIYLACSNKIVGAILFSLGLLTICSKGFALFTGKACYILDNKCDYIVYLIVVWIGNFLGAIITGLILNATYIGVALRAAANSLIDLKMDESFVSLFFLGFICNIFIYIAVSSFANNPHEFGKYICLIFAVAGFIICGTEHSVADMYYWAVSGRLYSDFGPSLLRILVISLGNIFGGCFFCFLEKIAKSKNEN